MTDIYDWIDNRLYVNGEYRAILESKSDDDGICNHIIALCNQAAECDCDTVALINDENLRLEAIIELTQRASLDHSCGLEGWDETCPECVLCRALIEHRKSND